MRNILAFLFAVIFLFSSKAFSQETKISPDFLKYEHSTWVDSIMQTLTPKERIAQLLMVAAYSNKGTAHKKEILKLIKKDKIGGLIFFQGGPARQARLMNDYQEASKTPLLGAIDAEWGLGMRLDSTLNYPFQMALGAVQNDSLIYKMGSEIAKNIKRVGLHINFAPVIDVNNNPDNPVINFRSFGENKFNVAKKGIEYMQGMQDNEVLATAKHFPGHGDTDTDSHLALPQINASKKRLDSLELYPFRKIIHAGIGAVMVAHLDIPALDSTGVPSTLSKPIVSGLLKGELGFGGLVVTDAMNMKGVTKGNPPGIVDREAVVAGNDLLEFTEDVPKAISEIQKAIKKGTLSQQQIDARCRKILALKQWAGLNKYKPTRLKNIVNDVNSPAAKLISRELTEKSLTVLRNENEILPIKSLDSVKIATVSFGNERDSTFLKTLKLYTKIEGFHLDENPTPEEFDEIKNQLKNYDKILVAVHDHSKYPRNDIKFSDVEMRFITELSEEKNVIISFFKNPYALKYFKNIENSEALIVTYQDSENAEEFAAQLIFGGVGANGKLPVSVGEKFREGDGISVKGGIRFKYTLPEDAGMDSKILNRGIDSLMNAAISAKATPGGVVLVAKDQKVVLYKAYGLQKYSDTVKVEKTDLYDLASVTKISAAIPVLMKLCDENKFSLKAGIDDYLPYFRHSNKAGIPFRQILAHQAGFEAWIPFWKNTLRKNGSFKWKTFKKDSSARFPIKVTDKMWLFRNYKKEIFKEIKKSPVSSEKKYVYSGLAFYLVPNIVENITGKNFVNYLNANFYKPLGASTLTYHPLKKFPLSRIVPTENDFDFRHTAIHGSVHDEGAIMMNGISTNAGLFSDANDLAKLMQMYLNKGEYGGKRYISEKTIEEFTKYQFPENDNRRALGFDKPALGKRTVNSNASLSASDASFGHTGFTGIMVWMDPKYDLLYIFLSNRVQPTRENNRLFKMNTRTNIQEVLYKAILK